MILFTCDQKLAKSQFSPTHAWTKRIMVDNGKTKAIESMTLPIWRIKV